MIRNDTKRLKTCFQLFERIFLVEISAKKAELFFIESKDCYEKENFFMKKTKLFYKRKAFYKILKREFCNF